MVVKNVLIAGAVAALAGAATADVIEYDVVVPAMLTDYAVTVQLPQFDPNIGTLLSVTVCVNGELVAEMVGENRSNQEANLTGLITEALSVQGPVGAPLSLDAESLPQGPQLVAAYDGVPYFIDPNGPDTVHWSLQLTDLVQDTYTDPGDLAVFTGGGMVDFDVIGDSSFVLSSDSGNVASEGFAEAGATITVKYEWIPAPGAAGLLTLAGVLANRRRRR